MESGEKEKAEGSREGGVSRGSRRHGGNPGKWEIWGRRTWRE